MAQSEDQYRFLERYSSLSQKEKQKINQLISGLLAEADKSFLCSAPQLPDSEDQGP